MTLRHLYIFRTVCTLQSITAAAEKLNMTQPAVSIAIKELESFYNARLFERMNRRIYVTEAGSTLLQYADTVLTQFDESIDVLRNSSSFHKCSFGVNVSIAETKLPNIASMIKKDIPDIDLKIYVENTTNIEKMLSNNEIDFAVVDNASHHHSWKSGLIFEEEMSAVCSPDFMPKRDSMTVEELSKEKLLLREKGSGSRSCVDAVFQSLGLLCSPSVESISTLSLISLSERGLGIAILPKSLIDDSLKRGSLTEIKITNGSFRRNYYLISHRNKFLTATMKSVIEIIKGCC